MGDGETELVQNRPPTRVSRWGVCIVTFTGTAGSTVLSSEWFNGLFADVDGVASYFRRMSGGRLDVEWEVFGPINLMTLPQKQALDAKGAGATIDGFRQSAGMLGIPVSNYDRFMWVINDQLSSGGTTPSDSLIGYDTITPQDAAHEMTHAFGVCSHADRLQLDDYADPFCLMGMGNTARSFQNPRLTVPGNFTHATTGPGLCAPYLYVAGWLDYKANVIEIGSGSVDEHVGETISLAANQGAPPWVSLQTIAVTFGAVPQTPNDPPQFWVEYRKPDGFDRGIDKPVSSNIADWPVEGGIILHKVTFGSARCPSQLHSMVSNWQGAAPGAVLTIPGTGYGLEITSVDRPGQRVQLTIKHTYDPDSWFDEYLSEFLILLGGVEVGAGGWSLNPRTGKREPVPPRPILPRELVPAERDLAIAQIVNRLAGLLSDETARAALSETALGAARKAQEILAGN